MQLGMKNKLYPTSRDKALLSAHFGCARKVYNVFLEKTWAQYEETGKTPSYYDMGVQLTQLKHEDEYQYLNDVPAVALRSALYDLSRAFTNLMQGRARAPKHRSRFDRQHVRYEAADIQDGWVRIPKIGWIRFRGESDGREWNSKEIVVSLDVDGTYWMSYRYDVELPHQDEPTESTTIGIDLGIKDMVATSDGRKINPDDIIPNFTALDQRLESRVRKYQRKMARQIKGSRRRARTKQLLARAYSRLARFRRYVLHLMSALLTKTHIVIEDLHVKGMFKLRSLAPKLQRLGLGEFLRQLKYKAPLNGKHCLEVSRWFPSSKLCWDCGSINHALTLADRQWTCSCGAVHDRDYNAASNIKWEGLRQRAEDLLVLAVTQPNTGRGRKTCSVAAG